MAIEIIPTGGALGAEVRGVDLSAPLVPASVEAIMAAWRAHLVLLFRDQRLPPQELARFSANFGTLDVVPAWRKFHPPGSEEVLVISNVKENGESIGVLGYGEAEWHTDMSYIDVPPRASVLHALEVPPKGGETSFLNMYKAYEDLPVADRAALQGRALNHDSSYDSAGNLRPGAPTFETAKDAPGARHPAILRHPETGRLALYLGRRRNAWIVGMDAAESDALLDRLWAHVLQDRYVWTHSWRVGDVLIWDNRCTMHRRAPFDPASRRLMHRTQIKGERPIAA
jgi:taurine dioxygenase